MIDKGSSSIGIPSKNDTHQFKQTKHFYKTK